MSDYSRSAFESAKRGAGTLLTGAVSALVIMVGVLGVMWGVEIVDYMLNGTLDHQFGIVGWDPDGLLGIVFAPFLHVGFGHLMANSLPLLILGFLAALRGVGKFLAASAVIIVIGGFGTWFTSPGVITVGASGLVFGYFGFVVARGLFDRRILDIVIAIGVAIAYYSILWGLLPNQQGISWQGHLFGLIGGVIAAWFLRRKRPESPYPAY
ncbi:rhomboid family intramembrane serine protease [Nonomuraea cavernae]|uniref:Rhomboid family intramembrane serine protease n=1 Tax=Nonomuraea cavernae TaxID=2045107 RepID=A0A917YYJ5_9ACTN|nr:rhomboid family intramembrane serine protease [Nonomuraea cavernae]MCA2187259.1 rhomboid family intramembrane serine protease [Nonomuraea cavernae]GGO68064.1 rhomboid family intramembrane serine protease [Nonomuraea cavernae]